ncbi:signal peptide protein [Caballeronia novacaledonica]|uniref:Signal peptide protein n=1 Tax=Caballeronia novacaledonica TaxID=1544861 RepID=A0A2U3IE75_9BURK|nr:signal peptide protein [Caballeronia novacaledonica]
MKSLLSRRGSVLDNAPSFLVRQKMHSPDRFPTHEIDADDDPKDEKLPAAPSPTRVTPLRPAGVPVQSSTRQLQAAQIAEIEWLVQQGSLSTFREFESFGYSASLLFYPRDLTYYAVLYHEGDVWRVLKAGDIDAAEPAFRHFIEQAMRFAEAEMRRAHLEAQNEQFSRLIAESEAQIERVRVDLNRGSEHDQEVALKQQEVRKTLAQLEGRRVAAQAQLNKLRRQAHQLDTTVNESVPHLPSLR